MAPVYKIAVIQFRPKPLSLTENHELSVKYIRLAASQGAHIAVLPEYHLTSWCPDEAGFIQACRDSMSYLGKYQHLSAELGINIVPGTICEVHPAPATINNNKADDDDDDDDDGGGGDGGGDRGDRNRDNKDIEIRNMTYFISSAGGALSGTYQKRNLWHPERPHLTAAPTSSPPHAAFDTPLEWPDGNLVRAGLLICWDAIFPESFRPLVMTGADVIIIPAFWLLDEDFGEVAEERIRRAREGERRLLESLCVTRAYENCCTVVLCNAGGGSQVAGPGVKPGEGGPMGVEEEGVKVVEVDLGEDRMLEGRYRVREDLRLMAEEGKEGERQLRDRDYEKVGGGGGGGGG